MSWPIILLLILGSLAVLMMTGLPIAFCFILFNTVGAIYFWGPHGGLLQLVLNMRHAVSSFTLIPVLLFVLMGEVMFQSGIGFRMINALAKWMGRLPGRLSLLTVGAGALFATMSGSTMASGALLGATLTPEMEQRGYKKAMSLGPILGSGGIAMMIPPSTQAVVLGAIAKVSIGQILMAIIIPGLLLAVFYVLYIVLRCRLQPDLAPSYDVEKVTLKDKVMDTVKYVFPLGFIIFLVIGFIFLGIATPSEAAATGTFGTFLLAALYKKLSWKVLKKSVVDTIEITAMIMIIMAGATTFSQLLAYSGATTSLVQFTMSANLPSTYIVIIMLLILTVLGMFISQIPIMLITLPIFMPIILKLGFNPVWFSILFLLIMEMSATTPPFGMLLFVVKGVAPKGTTMEDCYKAALPFLGCDLIVVILIMVFPAIANWLPSIMK